MREDKHSYKGWILSDFFWKRAISIMFYNAVGYLTIGVLAFMFDFVFGTNLSGLLTFGQ